MSVRTAWKTKKAAPQGVNVFWETLREPNFDDIVAMLAERGRIVLMAGRDSRPAFPVGPFYVKGEIPGVFDELRLPVERADARGAR